MSCSIPPPVEEYLQLIDEEEFPFCREQKALAVYIRKTFAAEELIFEVERFEKYARLQRYFDFSLFPWERCLFALWLCTYSAPGVPRWPTVFTMVGRGAGKDGVITFASTCLVSPYNPVQKYNVDICANNKDQAVRPVADIVEMLELPKQEIRLNKHFYHTKELVQGRRNLGIIKGHTNNPKGRDGLRPGVIIFNEVHAYENYDNIKVFTTALGKRAEPRTGIFTSNGDVSDGPLDDYIARSMRILFEGEPDNGFLPFICRLERKDQIDDPKNWYMANPSLRYMPNLMLETEREYADWKENPEQNPDFPTKRMGIRSAQKDIAVTEYEKILQTNRELPALAGWSCTVGVDYAELNDWAAVNLHFRRGDDRFDINHAWICAQSKTLPRVKAPWKAWAELGHVTVVEDVSISPDLLAEYIAAAGRKYNVRKLAMDNFRWTLVSESFKKIGFDAADRNRVKLIRPSDIMTVEPVIQECFDRGYFSWGNNPCLRWAVNNTKRVRSSRKLGVDTGNFIYAKIEAKSRKTDMFMALVASMVIEDALGSGMPVELPQIPAIVI